MGLKDTAYKTELETALCQASAENIKQFLAMPYTKEKISSQAIYANLYDALQAIKANSLAHNLSHWSFLAIMVKYEDFEFLNLILDACDVALGREGKNFYLNYFKAQNDKGVSLLMLAAYAPEGVMSFNFLFAKAESYLSKAELAEQFTISDKKGNTLLMHATTLKSMSAENIFNKAQNILTARSLAAQFAYKNTSNWTLVLLAASAKDPQVLEHCLQVLSKCPYPYTVLEPDLKMVNDNWTLLMLAVRYAKTDTVLDLLEIAAEKLNIADWQGQFSVRAQGNWNLIRLMQKFKPELYPIICDLKQQMPPVLFSHNAAIYPAPLLAQEITQEKVQDKMGSAMVPP